MEFKKVDIEGLLVIQPNIFEDDRGYFYESFNKQLFQQHGVEKDFVQDNQSLSQTGVLRGLHFQKPPYAQGKLIRVIQGRVLDVAVDLRKDSKTYGKYFSIELSGIDKTMFYIPEGFAHGFYTMENDTIFSYKCTNFYHKDSEGAMLWNDPDLNIDWGIEGTPVLSEKDKLADRLETFVTPF